jgi:acetyltransferase-like isoleucine patch superfamily enzyme
MMEESPDKPVVELESHVRKYGQNSWRQILRRIWLRNKLGSIGENVCVENNVRFLRHPKNIILGSHLIIKEGARLCPTHPKAKISIGDWTTIGHHTFLFSSFEISIGANCLIAPFCYLIDSDHGTHADTLIREQKMTASPITIGDDVWLGKGVTVLIGVTIGKGCVVGAGSVVTKDLPPYSIAAGSPAKIVSRRGP